MDKHTEDERRDEDIYDEKGPDDQLEDDEISPREAAFERGANKAAYIDLTKRSDEEKEEPNEAEDEEE